MSGALLLPPASSVGVGMLALSGGGPITLATVQNAIGEGYGGLFLDPREKWIMSGVVFNGIQNFIIESRMNGSIGFGGNISIPAGFIACDNSSGDGIQVYASAPSGATGTQGVIFKNCVISGSNPGANCLHLGGGQRSCGLVDTLVYNTSSAVGSYGVTSDTALSNNNGEDLIFSFTGGGGIAGNYKALGWGVNDLGQRSNDTTIYDLRTVSNNTSLDLVNGGGLTFVNWYDRSNPSVAGCSNAGVTRCVFLGGEDRNTAALNHIVSAAAARTIIQNRAQTQGGTSGNPTCQVSAGILMFQGACVFNTAQAINISGTGKVWITDPLTDPTNVSIAGAAGTLQLITAAKYLNGTGPTVTGWTGTTNAVLF